MLIYYGHPFSSYTWKVLIALYEKAVDFDYRILERDWPQHGEELRAHWPVGQFPLLVHDGVPHFESSIIIEYLDRLVPEPRLIPQDFDAALKVRLLDRVFDHHVMGRMQAVVADAIRGPENHVPMIVDQSKAALETVYGWLEKELAGGGWATPDGFTLADCAAAPSLFYADWVHEIDAKYENLRGYRTRRSRIRRYRAASRMPGRTAPISRSARPTAIEPAEINVDRRARPVSGQRPAKGLTRR